MYVLQLSDMAHHEEPNLDDLLYEDISGDVVVESEPSFAEVRNSHLV